MENLKYSTQVKPGGSQKVKFRSPRKQQGGGWGAEEECSSSESCRSERRGSSKRSWGVEGTTRSDFLMHLNIIKWGQSFVIIGCLPALFSVGINGLSYVQKGIIKDHIWFGQSDSNYQLPLLALRKMKSVRHLFKTQNVWDRSPEITAGSFSVPVFISISIHFELHRALKIIKVAVIFNSHSG